MMFDNTQRHRASSALDRCRALEEGLREVRTGESCSVKFQSPGNQADRLRGARVEEEMSYSAVRLICCLMPSGMPLMQA